MQPLNDRRSLNVRALLESTATPFAIADYGPRAAIFRQGDPCDSVMHIERGRVWLAVTARSGKEAICGLLDRGAFLGEEALVGRGERRQSATAMTATHVLVVAKAHMIRLLRTQPALLDRFIAQLLTRNTRLEANLTDQIFHSSEQRLAHTLLVLAHCDERRPRRCALPDLPQEIIAEMVGTTRSRVNAFMGKFKKLGFIEDTEEFSTSTRPVYMSFPMVIEVSPSPHPRRFRRRRSRRRGTGLWRDDDAHPRPLQSCSSY